MAQYKSNLQIIISLTTLLIAIFFLTVLVLRSFPQLLPSSPGKSLLSPSKNSTTYTYSAWIPYWDVARALSSLQTSADKLDLILPLWYELDSDAKLKPFPSQRKQALIDIADQNSLAIMPTLGNELDGDRVSLLLANPQLQQDLIDSLVTIAKQHDFVGWDFDLEQVPAVDRDKFSNFAAQAYQALKSNNLLLSLTLHAQTGSSKDWQGSQGQDYKALSESADFIRVMAYDFHYSTSDPGPVTPLDFLEEVITYASKTIPLDKLVIALPTYGYDWGPEIGEALQFADTINRLSQLDLETSRDKKSQALTTSYTKDNQAHEVWFEDATSLQAKLDLAKKKGIHQFTLWHLGGEDPEIWNNL